MRAFNMAYAAALSATLAVSLAPSSSLAGVMSVPSKEDISLSSSVDQVDWRACPHRRHHWHSAWRYGSPRYRYGAYAGGTAYGSAAMAPTCRAALPPYGVYGAASPTCGNCGGYYGYGGDGGLFGLGSGGGGLLGLGLGPL